ncbi:helicase-related protein [Bacillus massilinigeriensis]|uniref:helicase-related protein n=1 Tax=Bacillus massilionigeriensis TaxID=1805475 RepID=UPI00096AFD00|nr:helicase-related protein [Bacillus massilionigeriensis]
MSKLINIFPIAVEKTKTKIIEDINKFLGSKENIPSFEAYLEQRSSYMDQIWMNVWVNKATNDISKAEKKEYLSKKGFVVEGIDRKIINKLFRTEMRSYPAFDVKKWVIETFQTSGEEWTKQYIKARELYKQREAERILEEKRRGIQEKIEEAVIESIDNNIEQYYVYIRYQVGKQLAHDLKYNTRYRSIEPERLEEKLIQEDPFISADYKKVSDFLDELTGDVHQTVNWGRTYYEYESYYFIYERLIVRYLFDYVPDYLIKSNHEMNDLYKKATGEALSTSILMEMLEDLLFELADDFFINVQDEYLSDLLSVSEIPFETVEHQIIYERQRAEWEQRKALEMEEERRKKEEEVRILNDVFGQEYSLSLNTSTHYILHIGETNTGKTHDALERMKQANSGLYLAPLRLLALEVYDKLNNEGIPCSLKTGEEEKMIPDATHIACTVEMFHEKDDYDCVVIDEAQMIADQERGFSWYKAITKAKAREVHIIGSRNIKDLLLQLLGDSHIELHEYSRDIPLMVETTEFQLQSTKKGDALVCFSRKNVLETASKLQNKRYKVSMIYGSMPPETRKKQIQRFIEGETTVVVSTDAIGMGVNLPIRRIVFLENEKFDGTRRRRLTSQEVKQIAGRAGRKGIYDIGKVAFTKDIKIMRELLQQVDQPIGSFTIAPTNTVFEKFQKYYHHLGEFFELWDKFENPKGTSKATLMQEKELYELVRNTEIEARVSMMDLYGFLHLPFSTKDPGLTKQWLESMKAIIEGSELPEPIIKKRSLEELELSYKAIGLHLLFLYRLDRRTEAIYWERVRDEISNDTNESLTTEIKNYKKKCKRCGRNLPPDFAFPICDACHSLRYKRRYHTH